MIRTGIISFEHMHAWGYAHALQRCEETIFAAFAEEDPERRRTITKEFPAAHAFDSWKAMLEKEPLDAVIVTSANTRHREHAVAAARAGKHVLCEKPISTTLKDARAIIEACRKAGVKLQTAFPVRFCPAVTRAEADVLIDIDRAVAPGKTSPAWTELFVRAVGNAALSGMGMAVPDRRTALAGEAWLLLLCGRYEGVDERVRQHLVDDEISIGDYVLTGGELAALVLIDAMARHVPGVLGDEHAAARDSFAMGLLEGPHYTRPVSFRGWDVPAVLRSGHAGRITRWRREEALRRTWQRRPDLLLTAALDEDDRRFLMTLARETVEQEDERTQS